MTLRLHYHPLSSFCWKVLIALYENDTPFEPVLVDLSKQADRDAFYKLWPIGKVPVIEVTARDWMVPESNIIIEYLDQHYPGNTKFIPVDPDKARQTRIRDRFFDLYVQTPMQKIVGNRNLPAESRDAFGVAQARRQLHTALTMVEGDIGAGWVMGDDFTMADCAAAPALHYADKISPLAAEFPKTLAYLNRLCARPSFARVLKEAQPYAHMFPAQDR